jgi:hypothetical protein
VSLQSLAEVVARASCASAVPSTCSSSFAAFTSTFAVFTALLAFELVGSPISLLANSVTPSVATLKTFAVGGSFDFRSCRIVAGACTVSVPPLVNCIRSALPLAETWAAQLA